MSKDSVTRGKVVPDGLFYLIENHSTFNFLSHVRYVLTFKTVISLKISCQTKKRHTVARLLKMQPSETYHHASVPLLLIAHIV